MLSLATRRLLSNCSGAVVSRHRPALAVITTTIRYDSSEAASKSSSPWSNYEMAPLDPIVGLTESFLKDDSPDKVNVGVGAYRTDDGKFYVLPSVQKAEKILLKANLDMEYSGIAGDPEFVKLALQFAYGDDCEPLKDGRIQGVQALSGTGGLRVMGELLRKYGSTEIFVPDPTWGNHIPIFQNSGLEVKKYRYYNANKSSLDFKGMMDDLNKVPDKSVVLLHACAHNPTGMDPTLKQWQEISNLCKSKQLLPFFDCAYQGFASGDAAKDAAAIRMFVNDGHFMAMVQSFSKNFGLYGHRIGALSIVASSSDEASRVISQLKKVIRPMYSNPPRHGARIVSTILSDEKLTEKFIKECAGMARRIRQMRKLLKMKLAEAGSERKWDHITRQIGMFAYSGLQKEQVQRMRDEFHIYCTLDGRISMAGVTNQNVDYLAKAIHEVSK